MSVDPDKERPVGAGVANAAIVMQPVCIQSSFQAWPPDDSTFVACGSLSTVPFFSTSPGNKNLHLYLWKWFYLRKRYICFYEKPSLETAHYLMRLRPNPQISPRIAESRFGYLKVCSLLVLCQKNPKKQAIVLCLQLIRIFKRGR